MRYRWQYFNKRHNNSLIKKIHPKTLTMRIFSWTTLTTEEKSSKKTVVEVFLLYDEELFLQL
jgi:hypothetical protein